MRYTTTFVKWKMHEKRTRPEHFAQVLSLVIETLNNEGITIAVRFQLFVVGREDNLKFVAKKKKKLATWKWRNLLSSFRFAVFSLIYVRDPVCS